MKISYVTAFDARNIHSWSGAGFYIGKALKEQGGELEYIGDLSKRMSNLFKVKLEIKYNFYKILGKRFNKERNIGTASRFAKLIQSDIKPTTDVLFSAGSVPLSLVRTKKPKVFYADATFAGIVDFYDEYSNLCSETEREGHFLQKQILDECTLAIYSSDWAAQTAIDYYGTSPSKVAVVPFGANIESTRDINYIDNAIAARSTDECHLVFLGVDWSRKGGAIAAEAVKILNERGVKAYLHIAGIRDLPIQPIPPYIIDHGFISKGTAEGRQKFDELMAKSHFLFVPTRAEAFGLVFCEANSYGIPSIATDVGGIPTIVKDGVNGQKFSLTASPTEYADYIESLFFNRKAYRELAVSSYNEYESRLNWRVSGRKIMDLLQAV